MRYIILVILILPALISALLNIYIQYKMKRLEKSQFRQQSFVWIIIGVIIILSFPIYNLSNGRPPLSSGDLSWIDVAQTTAIIYLFYFLLRSRQHLELTERGLRDLHQELAIKLSSNGNKH